MRHETGGRGSKIHVRHARIGGAAALLTLLALGPTWGQRGSSAPTEFVPTFSTNSRVKQQLERMDRLAAQKQWDEWLAGYQQLVNDPQDLVLQKDSEFLVGVRYHAHQLLAGLPAAARDRYRIVYDAEARQLYEKASAEGDPKAMRALYSRFRFSSYANRGLLWIANRAMDDGSVDLARVAYARAAKDPSVTAGTLLRYAMAARAAGQPEEARAVIERIRKEFAQQPVKLAGREMTAAEAGDRLLSELGRSAIAAASGARWTSFSGGSPGRQMSGPVSGILKRLWSFEQPTSAASAFYSGYRSVNVTTSFSGRSRFSFATWPVLDGNRMWVQGPRNVTAVDLSTGQAVWDQQEWTMGADEVARINGNPRTGGYYARSSRPVQAAPALEGRFLVVRMPVTAMDSTTSRWPADFAISVIDSRTGRQLWRKVAGGEPGGIYYNAPTIRSNAIYTGVATYKGGITEYNAVCLDAGSGDTLWSTYLGGGSDPLFVMDGSPAAVKDGLVWIESTLHTLNALDMITGEIRQIYKYPPLLYSGSSYGVSSTPILTNEPLSLVASTGPIVFAPRWGADVVAFDSTTGKLLWSAPKAPGRSAVGSLFAVDDKRAYVCGDQITALNLEDGSPAWSWDARSAATGDLGFAGLVGNRIYLPADNKIYVRAADDGRDLETLTLPLEMEDARGFSTLIALDGKLVIATQDRIALYAPQ